MTIKQNSSWASLWILIVYFIIASCAGTRHQAKPTLQIPNSYQAKVVRVIDGDTIVVLRDHLQTKIRLFGVDCPEKRQPFGTKAKQFTADHVFGEMVAVVPTGNFHRDRIIASIYLVDSRDLAALLLEAGLGWWSKKYAPTRNDYETLANDARQAQRGLWIQPKPTEPSLFRRNTRHSKERLSN